MSNDANVNAFNTENRSPLIKVLRFLAVLLPGDYLKTFVYLNFIEKPRRFHGVERRCGAHLDAG